MAVVAACAVIKPHIRGVEVPASLPTHPFLGGDTLSCLHTLREVHAQAGVHEWMSRGNGGARVHFGGLLCSVSAASLHQLPIFKMEGI